MNKHTEPVKKLHVDSSWHALKTPKSKDLATLGFQDTPTKIAEAKPSFRKVSLPPAKLCMLFPAHL